MNYVPLPEVAEHTDRIVVGELGLPVGFDLERLELQVPKVEKICQLAGIGQLALAGYRGETTEYSFGVGGVDSAGTAAATRVMNVSKAATSSTELNNPDKSLPSEYRWHDTTVKFNNAEIEERIKNDGQKWDRGVFDPAARAKYMNQALKKGLASTTNETIFDGAPIPARVAISVGSFAMASLIYKWSWSLGSIEAGAGLWYGARHALNEGFHIFKRNTTPDLPVRRMSVFPSTHYDRYASALGLTGSTKLIRAKD